MNKVNVCLFCFYCKVFNAFVICFISFTFFGFSFVNISVCSSIYNTVR